MTSPQTITMNSRARGEPHLANVDRVPFRGAAQLGIGRERILRLGHADGIVPVALVLELLDLRPDLAVCSDFRSSVYLFRDLVDLVPQRIVVFVDVLNGGRPVAQLHHFARELGRPLAAIRPVRREHDRRAEFAHARLEQFELGGRVAGELVDRHHAPDAVVLLHVLDVALEVDDALRERVDVLGGQRLHVHATVVFQRAHGRDDHRGVRFQAALAALDVDELLGPEIGAESGLGNDVIGELEGALRGDHRVASVRDVRERPAVDERGIVLERLHQVGLERVLQEHRHRPVRLEVLRADRLLIACVADHNVAQAFLEILQRGGEAEDGHHLGGHHDVEAVLARIPVGRPAERNHDVAQRTIVHVEHALPLDPACIDAERVAVVDVVVQHRGKQVVRELDGAEIAGEMKVDVLHRHHLCMAATSRATLHSEHRSERGLSEADHRFLADEIQRIAEADGGRRLALAGGRGRHCRHQDELGVGPGLEGVQVLQRNLRLVVTIGLEVLLGDTEFLLCDLSDALQFRCLGDLDVRSHDGSPRFPRPHEMRRICRHYRLPGRVLTLTPVKSAAATGRSVLAQYSKSRFASGYGIASRWNDT